MTKQIEEYSVGQMARLSGVSIRTLHHYDDIGLLKPAYTSGNGYRLYHRPQMMRLQEILFYRDVGLSLSEIADLLNSPHDAVQRLEQHRGRLEQQHRRTAGIIETLDATIDHLKGKRDMAISDLYIPFTTGEQANYEAWLIQRYGADMAAQIAISQAAVSVLPGGMERALQELKSVETDLVSAYESGTDTAADCLHALFEQHRAWVARMWGDKCDADGYEGLADMYMSHPDFISRYETLSPRFSNWLFSAMKNHAGRLRNES